MKRIPAYVYLLHFERPYRHARHYVGYTALESVAARLERHRSGNGARLLRVCNDHGIAYTLARIWEFPTIALARAHELSLKRSGHSVRICPTCRAERNGHEQTHETLSVYGV